MYISTSKEALPMIKLIPLLSVAAGTFVLYSYYINTLGLQEKKMVTKKDVEKARADYYDAEAASMAAAWTADAEAAVVVAWDNYQKLKEAFKNGN